MRVYKVRSRKDHRGVDLISDVLPFGRLCFTDRARMRIDCRMTTHAVNDSCTLYD